MQDCLANGCDFTLNNSLPGTIMILSFQTDMPGQTDLEQSDQGLHCLPLRLHGWTHYSMVEPHS